MTDPNIERRAGAAAYTAITQGLQNPDKPEADATLPPIGVVAIYGALVSGLAEDHEAMMRSLLETGENGTKEESLDGEVDVGMGDVKVEP